MRSVARLSRFTEPFESRLEVGGGVSREPRATVLAPLTALLAAFVLRLVTRIARQQATLAETTAAITTTSLPLLLVPVPTIGPPIGITLWLLAGIFLLQRVTHARLDVAAVVTLLSHALTTGVLIGIGYAVEALI